MYHIHDYIDTANPLTACQYMMANKVKMPQGVVTDVKIHVRCVPVD